MTQASKRIIEFIITFLKGGEPYRFNVEYSFKQMFFIIWYRLLQIVRGAKLKIKIGRTSGVIFCGRNVVIEHGYQMCCGRSTIIEDNVFINALSSEGIVLGNNVTIAKNSILVCTGVISNKGVGIKIGNNSAIGAQSFLGGQGGIEIGNDVICGPGIKIFSENHNYSATDKNIRKQGTNRKGVIIKNDCWIGAGSIILDGITIDSGCVIAAGSIVTKNFPCNSIIAGVPAKIIKNRISNKV